ncbi:hypothetical protein [Rhodococcus sp. LB1]|uniref:hypothetical protein n=1 Tax=Rhodococcus sp. LB1 TaxID=1807499 RepID=UPI00077AA894|nr:hypothetical protein [Rhodococcus sp. LB1]KXX59710.1 hypothetical protein AZG88_06740 [Rhodococcus sp. LB1]
MTTSLTLASKVWYLIHRSIAEMPTAEFVERLAHCAQHPQDIQPVWKIDRATNSVTITWGGADLFVGGADVLAWLCDDDNRDMPDGGWVPDPTAPDDASELDGDTDTP